jgi:predicted nucleic acid-binding protein
MSRVAIYDTSIVIDLIRTGGFFEQIQEREYILRGSSVVLAELWRGASARVDREIVRWMEENFRILTPTENNWIESGQLLARMQKDHGFEPKKLRELHFDVLIALTCRTHGALLVTSNRADFELIREYRAFGLEVW